MLKPTTDAGVTTGLSEAIGTLLPALENFLRFEDKDLAAVSLTSGSHGDGRLTRI